MTQAYTSRQGALWVQPGGPNSISYFLGCHDLDDISEPLSGGKELIRKFNPSGRGWVTVGNTQTPPDPVTTTITALMFKQRDWLEKLNCPFTLFVLMRDCGYANEFTNYSRGYALRNTEPLNRTFSNLVMREEEAASTVAMEVSADALVQINDLVIDRLGYAGALALNGVWTNKDTQCYGPCGDTIEAGELLIAGSDSAVGPATGDVAYSANGGATVAALAVDPFGAGINVMGATSFIVGQNTRRILVANMGGLAAQGMVAYSDDTGATWTTVNVGGAAEGRGAVQAQALFALNSSNIYLASDDGYIYKSVDGAETWVAVESGVIAVGPYASIYFADELNGIAASVAGELVITSDGGETWNELTPVGVPNTVTMIDANKLWYGTTGGTLYYSSDAGITWTQRTGWVGSGVGAVRHVQFYDELVGYMISNTAAPVGTVLRTIDGGYTWNVVTTPANSGLNMLSIADASTVFVSGEANGGTGVLLRVSASD
jgi:photosystem II stability/assembly factor-like uncharacterized protein